MDEEEKVSELIENWDTTLFGGNKGIVRYKPKHTAGLIKQVERLEEEEINEEIKNQFPDCHIELFKKNSRFTGTVKINFPNEELLQQAIQQKIRINGLIYCVEVFEPKPKVIKCNICQIIGHVSRMCKNQNSPTCGKCSGKDHQTKDCDVQENDYKCAHCSGNHITGSYTCQKMKDKLEQIMNRNGS